MLLGQDLLRPRIDPRVYKEAKSLLSAGFGVTVISLSGFPPITQNYEGIDLRILTDQVNLPRLRDKSILLVLPKIFFGLIKNLKNITKIARGINYSVIHCHDADTLLFGLFLKLGQRGKVKLFYDSHEIATEMSSFTAFKPMVSLIERIASYFTDGFITINDSARKFILSKYPRFSRRVLVLKNLPLVRTKISAHEVSKPVKFIYQGNMKKDRQGVFAQILETLKQFDPKTWTLTLLVDQTDLDNIELSAPNIIIKKCIVDPLKFQQELNHYDIGIISMDNICLNNYYSLPNKLFDYMTSGVAIISPDYPEIAKVIHDAKNGLLFKNESDLKKSIGFFLSHSEEISQMKKNGLKAVQESYNWSIESDKLIQFYQELI